MRMSIAFISKRGSLIFPIMTDLTFPTGTLHQLRSFSITFTPEFVRKRIALFSAPFSAFFNYLFPCKLQP